MYWRGRNARVYQRRVCQNGKDSLVARHQRHLGGAVNARDTRSEAAHKHKGAPLRSL